MKQLILLLFLLLLLSANSFAATSSTIYRGSFGLQLVGGTNQSRLFRADLFYSYNKKWDHEWTFKLRSDFQSIGTQEISKHISSIRYGKSINEKWYYFYRLDLVVYRWCVEI